MQRRDWQLATLLVAILATACSGKGEVEAGGQAKSLGSGGEEGAKLDGKTHCAANDAEHESSEYDTSGDDVPDVRKVFLRVGKAPLVRLVLVCRESDLNADGTKDVVRYYNEEGRPLREEADRDFDGDMDEVTFFQEGVIVRQEFDSSGDGKVDTKIFFESGKPLRAERDLAARSTVNQWQPNRWEYFEGGRMVRMGTDLDGDGKVDRWDRDARLNKTSKSGGA